FLVVLRRYGDVRVAARRLSHISPRTEGRYGIAGQKGLAGTAGEGLRRVREARRVGDRGAVARPASVSAFAVPRGGGRAATAATQVLYRACPRTRCPLLPHRLAGRALSPAARPLLPFVLPTH